MKLLKVVLDTNILLVSISSKSPYHWLFQNLLTGRFDLYVTTDILMEYEEIIATKYHPQVAKDVLRTLLKLPNVHRQFVYSRWNLIANDPDDDKFVDCAIAGNVHYLVSQDKPFDVLKNIAFPRVTVLNLESFKVILLGPE